jgi:hypothetical protein
MPRDSANRVASTIEQRKILVMESSEPKTRTTENSILGSGMSSSTGSARSAHGKFATVGGYQRQRLTDRALVDHQRGQSDLHTNPSAVIAAREFEEECIEKAARTVGFTLPLSAAKSFRAMSPVERYVAERDVARGPFSVMKCPS